MNPLATLETGSTAVQHTLLMQAKSSKFIALPVSNIKAKQHWIQQKVPEYLPHSAHLYHLTPVGFQYTYKWFYWQTRTLLQKASSVCCLNAEQMSVSFFWPPIILPRLTSLIYILLFHITYFHCFIKAWMFCFVTMYVEPCQHHTGHTRDGTLWVLWQNTNFGMKHSVVLKDRES